MRDAGLIQEAMISRRLMARTAVEGLCSPRKRRGQRLSTKRRWLTIPPKDALNRPEEGMRCASSRRMRVGLTWRAGKAGGVPRVAQQSRGRSRDGSDSASRPKDCTFMAVDGADRGDVSGDGFPGSCPPRASDSLNFVRYTAKFARDHLYTYTNELGYRPGVCGSEGQCLFRCAAVPAEG